MREDMFVFVFSGFALFLVPLGHIFQVFMVWGGTRVKRHLPGVFQGQTTPFFGPFFKVLRKFLF
jgi:hypothetical protein